MSAAFAVVGTILAVVAALIHLVIFALESVLWTRPSTMRTFGIRDPKDAEVLRPMAFNQGFYNLFLAIGVAVGLAVAASGVSHEAGLGVTLFALASMLLAAIVLVASNPRLRRAALVQGLAPAGAIAAIGASILTA
jgi:putative membrane protein